MTFRYAKVALLAVALAGSLSSCFKEVGPDLEFPTTLATQTNWCYNPWAGSWYTWTVTPYNFFYEVSYYDNFGVYRTLYLYFDFYTYTWKDFCGNDHDIRYYVIPPSTLREKVFVVNRQSTQANTTTEDSGMGEFLGFVQGVDPVGNTTIDTIYQLIPSLPANFTHSLDVTRNVYAYGTFNEFYHIDPDNEIAERNESNNVTDQDVNIGRASGMRPSFEISKIKLSDLDGFAGEIWVFKGERLHRFESVAELLQDPELAGDIDKD